MINEYFSLLSKLLHAIAKFCQISWRIVRKKTRGSIFFWKDTAKINLLVGNSAKKILNLRLRFFECKFFMFITLYPSGRTRSILEQMSKRKQEKDFFSFGFKKKPPRKLSNNVYSFQLDDIPRYTEPIL